MHEKFEKQIEEGLTAMAAGCQKKKQSVATINQRVGALLAKNSRAKRLFRVDVQTREDGGADVSWEKVEAQRNWSELSEGCYLLRSNIMDWSAEDLWKAYIQLTEAETAFRIQKDDLKLQGRSEASPNLASEERACSSPYPRLFPCVCCLENLRSTLQAGPSG